MSNKSYALSNASYFVLVLTFYTFLWRHHIVRTAHYWSNYIAIPIVLTYLNYLTFLYYPLKRIINSVVLPGIKHLLNFPSLRKIQNFRLTTRPCWSYCTSSGPRLLQC